MIPKAHNPNWDFFCLNGVVQAITSSNVEDKIIYTLYVFQTFNTLRKEKESLIRRKKSVLWRTQKLIRFLWKL